MFQYRFDAGMRLAKLLAHYKNKKECVIIAIPRGGVEIGAVSIDDGVVDPFYENHPAYRDYVQQEKKRIRQLLRKANQ